MALGFSDDTAARLGLMITGRRPGEEALSQQQNTSGRQNLLAAAAAMLMNSQRRRSTLAGGIGAGLAAAGISQRNRNVTTAEQQALQYARQQDAIKERRLQGTADIGAQHKRAQIGKLDADAKREEILQQMLAETFGPQETPPQTGGLAAPLPTGAPDLSSVTGGGRPILPPAAPATPYPGQGQQAIDAPAASQSAGSPSLRQTKAAAYRKLANDLASRGYVDQAAKYAELAASMAGRRQVVPLGGTSRVVSVDDIAPGTEFPRTRSPDQIEALKATEAERDISNAQTLYGNIKPVRNEMRKLRTAYERLSAVLSGDSPIESYTSLQQYLKLLDPDSAVLGGELAGVKQDAQSAYTQLVNAIELRVQGRLPWETKRDIQVAANKLIGVYRSAFGRTLARQEKLADQYPRLNRYHVTGGPARDFEAYDPGRFNAEGYDMSKGLSSIRDAAGKDRDVSSVTGGARR